MLVYINSSSSHIYTHTQAGWQKGQFGSVQLASIRSGVMEKQGTRVPGTTHWVESESLESWLACVGAGVQLWWPVGRQWRVCVLRRRFSRDCRKERRALSSSRGDEPSSSTSAISAKVTGCVLKRASRDRRERLLPLAGPLGTGSCWGNSSMAEAIRWAGKAWKPGASITIWRTAAIGRTVMGMKVNQMWRQLEEDSWLPVHLSDFSLLAPRPVWREGSGAKQGFVQSQAEQTLLRKSRHAED